MKIPLYIVSRIDDRGVELAEHMVHAIRNEPNRLGTYFSPKEISQALSALDAIRKVTK